jgi:hypothetical protein
MIRPGSLTIFRQKDRTAPYVLLVIDLPSRDCFDVYRTLSIMSDRKSWHIISRTFWFLTQTFRVGHDEQCDFIP